jgi:Ca2+-binding RTX toxin-like protein
VVAPDGSAMRRLTPYVVRRTSTGARCTVVGTPRADVLIGSTRDDVVCGLGGDDRIVARDGDDVVDGGSGRDRIVGGAGDDTLLGVRVATCSSRRTGSATASTAAADETAAASTRATGCARWRSSTGPAAPPRKKPGSEGLGFLRRYDRAP